MYSFGVEPIGESGERVDHPMQLSMYDRATNKLATIVPNESIKYIDGPLNGNGLNEAIIRRLLRCKFDGLCAKILRSCGLHVRPQCTESIAAVFFFPYLKEHT
jgi:hypothetical protein